VLADRCDLLQSGEQVAVLIQVADDGLGGAADLVGIKLTLNCERKWSPSVTGAERKVSNEGFSTDSEAGLL